MKAARLVCTIGTLVTVVLLGCSSGEEPENDGIPSSPSGPTWRLEIARGDGRVEMIDFVEKPYICQTDSVRMYFCGTGYTPDGQLIAIDYVQVNPSAGDTYSLEEVSDDSE